MAELKDVSWVQVKGEATEGGRGPSPGPCVQWYGSMTQSYGIRSH